MCYGICRDFQQGDVEGSTGHRWRGAVSGESRGDSPPRPYWSTYVCCWLVRWAHNMHAYLTYRPALPYADPIGGQAGCPSPSPAGREGPRARSRCQVRRRRIVVRGGLRAPGRCRQIRVGTWSDQPARRGSSAPAPCAVVGGSMEPRGRERAAWSGRAPRVAGSVAGGGARGSA